MVRTRSGRKQTQAARDSWSAMRAVFLSDVLHDRILDACQTVGLTPPAMKALLSLEPGEARPMGELAHQWHCDASWVTSLVDSLEQLGLAERQVSPTDRRVKAVSITTAGLEAKQQLLEVLDEPPEAMGALSGAEQRALRDLLQRVVAALDAERAARADG